MFELMKADQDGGAGRRLLAHDYLRLAFAPHDPAARLHLRRPRAITAPTLILVGDRDEFCSVEEAVDRLPAAPTR